MLSKYTVAFGEKLLFAGWFEMDYYAVFLLIACLSGLSVSSELSVSVKLKFQADRLEPQDIQHKVM